MSDFSPVLLSNPLPRPLLSYNGAYDLNSSEVTPFAGAGVIAARPNPGGALSLFSSSPFLGRAAGGSAGWDALDFWMRGPQGARARGGAGDAGARGG